MIKIYSNESLIHVHHIKATLESHAIDCIIKNENLTSLAGEIPSFECWPEIWVVNNAQKDIAMSLIDSLKEDAKQNKAVWICDSCKEEIEGEFEICWQCGALKT